MDTIPRKIIARSGEETFLKTGLVRTNQAYETMKDRSFAGQSGNLTIEPGHEALFVLENPKDSTRRIFVDLVSITPTLPRRYLFYLDAETPLRLHTSSLVANAHAGARRRPEARIRYVTAETVPVTGGSQAFQRLLPGGETSLLEYGGRYVLEPGHNFAARALADDSTLGELALAFAWWEEPLS